MNKILLFFDCCPSQFGGDYGWVGGQKRKLYSVLNR